VCLFDMNDEIHRIDIPDHPVFLTSGGSIQIKIPEHPRRQESCRLDF